MEEWHIKNNVEFRNTIIFVLFDLFRYNYT
nr:MAG TPA: hypothetical protein [Caudoviricetes sp.]